MPRSAIYRGLPIALRGLSPREVYIWRSLVLPSVVGDAALTVAIVGAIVVGSGDGIDSINVFANGTGSGNFEQFLGGLIGASALFALAAGMASAVNPCGFAMLPAYLGLDLGSGLNEDEKLSPARSLGRNVHRVLLVEHRPRPALERGYPPDQLNR